MAQNKILLSDNLTELANVKSVVYKEVVNADVDIRPGCVASASIEVEVYNTQANAISAGDVVYYYQIDKNDVATLIGEFVCEPVITTKGSYKFVAYDNAQKLNADFSQWLQANQANFPMTIYSLVSAACTVAGVTLGSASWQFSTEKVLGFYTNNITCRDILSYAAELACCYVRCHTDGELYFEWYSANSNTIAPSVSTNQYAYKADGLTYANYTTTALARVAVHPNGYEDVAYVYPSGVTSGNTLHIINNLFLRNAEATFYETVAQHIYTTISALGTYRPMTAELFAKENPFRAGDIVSVTDIQNVTFTAIITRMTVSASGATLESTGYQVYGDQADTQKTLTQIASSLKETSDLALQANETAQNTADGLADMDISITDLREDFFSELDLKANVSQLEMTEQTVATLQDQYGNIIDTEALLEQRTSTLEQTASQFSITFTQIENDLSDTNDSLTEVRSWIQESADGIVLGKSNSAVQLRITNNAIEIIEDGNVITYWNNQAQQTPQSLTIPEGGSFTMGNFRWTPRASGNLSLVKV